MNEATILTALISALATIVVAILPVWLGLRKMQMDATKSEAHEDSQERLRLRNELRDIIQQQDKKIVDQGNRIRALEEMHAKVVIERDALRVHAEGVERLNKILLLTNDHQHATLQAWAEMRRNGETA